jgi:hypothetical protein
MATNRTIPYERSLKRSKSTSYRMEISPEAYKAFMQGILNGLGIDPASRSAGLFPATVKHWLEKGKILEGEELPENTAAWQYSRFWTDYQKARALFEASHVNNICRHSETNRKGQWTASAWLLERRRPKDYSNGFIVQKQAEAQVLETIKFIFDQSPTALFREQFAAIVGMVPALKLSEGDEYES